jgi:hypothetical protein
VSILIKTSPIELFIGESVRFTGVSDLSKTTKVSGIRAYIWFSETQGGVGLAGVGRISCVHAIKGEADVSVTVGQVCFNIITNAVLKPHRDTGEATPIAALAREIYKNSHNRILNLSPLAAQAIESALAEVDAHA